MLKYCQNAIDFVVTVTLIGINIDRNISLQEHVTS